MRTGGRSISTVSVPSPVGISSVGRAPTSIFPSCM